MPLTNYETKHLSDDGRVYVVVTLDDGSSFGQYIAAGTQAEMDVEVDAHVQRYEVQRSRPPRPTPALGVVRTAAQVEQSRPGRG